MANGNPKSGKRKDAATWEREAGLALRSKYRMVMIREDYLVICDGDACAAALLRTLQNWHYHKLQCGEQGALEDTDVWTYMPLRQAVDELAGEYSRNRVIAALDRLADKGLALRRHNPANKRDRTLQYQFAVSSVRLALSGLPEKDSRRFETHSPSQDDGVQGSAFHSPSQDYGDTLNCTHHSPNQDDAKSQPEQFIVPSGTNNTTDNYTDVGVSTIPPTSGSSTVYTSCKADAEKLLENQQPGEERGADAAPTPSAASDVDADADNSGGADRGEVLATAVQYHSDPRTLAAVSPRVTAQDHQFDTAAEETAVSAPPPMIADTPPTETTSAACEINHKVNSLNAALPTWEQLLAQRGRGGMREHLAAVWPQTVATVAERSAKAGDMLGDAKIRWGVEKIYVDVTTDEVCSRLAEKGQNLILRALARTVGVDSETMPPLVVRHVPPAPTEYIPPPTAEEISRMPFETQAAFRVASRSKNAV